MTPEMRKLISSVNQRSTKQKVAVWVVTILILAGGFYQFLYQGSLEQLQQLTEKVESLNDQIMAEQRLARNLVQYRKEVRALEAKLKVALQELPDKSEIPSLLSSISTLAKEAGLEFALIKPLDEVRRDFYAEVPVSVSLQGGFHQITSFLDEVGKMSRIVNVHSIAMREPYRSDDSAVVVKGECVATTFRYLDESERQEQKAQQETQKKDKRRR